MQPSQSVYDTRPGQVYGIFHVDHPEITEYIGQTVGTLESRRKGHIYDALSRSYSSSTPMHNFVRKYGADRVGIRSIRDCVGYEDLNRSEEELIAEYKSRGEARLNVRPGGLNTPMAEESREKLRQAFSGQNSPVTNLTWDRVRKARDMYVSGAPLTQIGDFLEISVRQRDKILRNRQWVDPNYEVPERRTTATVNWEIVAQIRKEAMARHELRSVIADRYGVSKVLIEKILGNTMWKSANYDPSMLPSVDYSVRPTPGIKRIFPVEIVRSIRQRYAAGESIQSIHRDYPESSYATVRNVAKSLNAYSQVE